MVKAALTQLEGSGNVVHRGRIVSALLKETGGGTKNVLPGINGGIAGHDRHGNDSRALLPSDAP
jgi:hypothetical protein